MTKEVTIQFAKDWILIPPSKSQVETLGGLLRASTLTVNGTAVQGDGDTLPTRRLSIAQVAHIGAMSKSARTAAFAAGKLVLPVSKRGRKPSTRGTRDVDAFFAPAETAAPRQRKPRASKAPATATASEATAASN